MARLPVSATRLEGRDVNLRRGDLPVRFNHPVRELDERMDDIVYNAIDMIQERAKDNELRTFYFNLMSDNDYKNRDFENIVGMIADVIDIGVQEGKFRDVRDAVIPVTEDVLMLHIGYMCDEYPDLMEYVDRRQERDIDRATQTYQKYQEAIDVYRRNGHQLPERGRGRGRERDDRDDRGRGVNYGSDRGGRDRDRDDRGGSRRDRWDRGAVRGGVHGEPRRTVQTRENRFGNSDQRDRFDDEVGGQTNERDNDRRDDDRRSDSRTKRDDDRYDSGVSVRREETPRTERAPSRIQRLPGRMQEESDITDALAREASEKGSNMTSSNEMSKRPQVADVQTNNPILSAFENLDAWLPSTTNPHPLAFNHNQDLFYEMGLDDGIVIPRIINKDQIVDYYAHASMAFGASPKDFSRFEDGGQVATRLNALHEALVNPSEEFTVDGSDDTVTYHNRLDFTEHSFLAYSLKDVLVRLNYRRFAQERNQPNGDAYHAVEIAVGSASIIDSFIATEEESALLEELRSVSSFTKLCEKLRHMAKRVRPELFLQVDRHFTKAVNRMMRQHLSIPSLKITSFTSDWLELFAHITEKFGDGYRDAINTHQEREIRNLMHYDQDAEIYVLSQLPDGNTGIKPFIVSMPTKMIYLNEVGYNLDIDMVPDVASQILPEANAFFHDLAQDLLTKGADAYGRFYIQTSDMRVLEASRSYLNDKAIMLRMIQ